MPKDPRLTKLYNKINSEIFDSALPHSRTSNFALRVSGKMTRALGNCRFSPMSKTAKNQINISKRINDWQGDLPSKQLVQTLVHEMAHLQMNIEDGGFSSAGHGPRWQKAYITAAKRYDETYGTSYMSQYAISQCHGQYSNHRENPARAVDQSGNRTAMKKWDVTCPVCGFHMSCNRMGRIIKKACATEGLVRHGHGCKAKLVAIKMR